MMLSLWRLQNLFCYYLVLAIRLMPVFLPTAEATHASVLSSFDQEYSFTSNNSERTTGEKLLTYATISILETMSWGWQTARRAVVLIVMWLIYWDVNGFIPKLWLHISWIVGVPKSRRGEIWQFLALQYRLRHRLPNKHQPPDTSYKELLKQLTAQQHAILVDLGMSVKWVVIYKSKRQLGVGWLVGINGEGLLASAELLTVLFG